jgi:histidyl-tRNA synthetase
MPTRSVPGFRDFYPEEAALRNHIFAVWRYVAGHYGFEEWDGPLLEPLELYIEKSGPEIVEQLYNFEDKGGRAVSLRPEMTPTLARMVAARARALKKPIRWFTIGQMFRYERQQRGRLREHYQLNMDLIGEPGPLADAEVIAAAIDLLRAFGFGADDVRAHVSDRRLAHALLAGQGLTEDQIVAAYAHIDKLGRESHEALVKALAERAGLSRDAAQAALSIGDIRDLDEARRVLGDGDPAVLESLSECVGGLEAMGLGEFVTVDLGIVRGLAYYTGTVFELFDARRSLRAICGGGRYDRLLGALGGVDLPATGFAMGDVVLGELLRDRGAVPERGGTVDAFVVAVTGEDGPSVLRQAHELRDAGVSVEYALKLQSVGKQLKLAAARGARYAVVIGPDERADGVAVVRDLASGEERRVPFGELGPATFDIEHGNPEGQG